jgi:hypothetical protein
LKGDRAQVERRLVATEHVLKLPMSRKAWRLSWWVPGGKSIVRCWRDF